MENKAHSLTNNIRYFSKMQWQLGKLSYVFILMQIPINLILTLCIIYLPALAVHGLINNNEPIEIVLPLVFLGMAIIILNSFKIVIETLNYTALIKYTSAVTFKKIEKTVRTDYENIESSKCRHLLQRSDEALWIMGTDCALTNFARSSGEIITNLLGLLLFGSMLVLITPWLIILLIITQIIHFAIIKNVQEQQYLSRKYTEPLDRKLWYIANNSGDYANGKDIRIYGINHWFINMFKLLTNDRLSWERKFSAKYFKASFSEGLIILIRDGFSYVVLIYMALNNQITIDEFILYFAVIGSFATWIGGIISKMIDLNHDSSLLSDLRDYLDFPENNNRQETTSIAQNVIFDKVGDKPPAIEIKNVTYRFSGAKEDTIRDISLNIKSGEKIAIVGLNGAGKTTLVKLISGLYSATKGEIYIDGIEKNEFNIYDYYSLFSIAFQDFYFLPISIASNIACQDADVLDTKRVIQSMKKAEIYDFVSELHDHENTLLNKQINENGIELSGGQLQRLLLARTIYKNTPIIILDEPTAALDPIVESELFQKYNEITRNKTSIFISHRLASTRFCDRILFFEKGKIVEEGSHEFLMQTNGKYQNLYNIQSRYYNLSDIPQNSEMIT